MKVNQEQGQEDCYEVLVCTAHSYLEDLEDKIFVFYSINPKLLSINQS